MTAHTPTPWSLSSLIDIRGADGKVRPVQVVNPFLSSAQERKRGEVPEVLEAQANAAFVVKACNAHVSLVGALKICRENIDKNPHRDCATLAALRVIDNALKLAGEE